MSAGPPSPIHTLAVAIAVTLLAPAILSLPGIQAVTDDPGWPEIEEATIRPGVRIAFDCTADFIFSSPNNKTFYIGTASHCMGGRSIGDLITIGSLGIAGTLVYCSWMHTENEDHCPQSEFLLNSNDFALVEIQNRYRKEVHPALYHWGGPTGIGDPPSSMTKLHTYGNSALTPAGPMRPMEGYSTFSDSQSTHMYSLRPGIWGDSGSPVIRHDGQTVGVLVAINLPTGQNVVSNLKADLEYMTWQTGIQAELKTWEVLEPGILPAN